MEDLEDHLVIFNERHRKDPSGCWEWTAGKTLDGYGRFQLHGRQFLAHRFAYLVHKGEIPDGLQMDHLCRNRGCCNPDHLEPVTPLENARRGIHFNSAKTECENGHPFDGENTYVRPDGVRRCRACGRDATARWRANRLASSAHIT